jgi:flagellar hook protein FlgE
MAILGALSIARSGLIATGEALSVTGNNIANVNTIAFKGSRSEFSDLLAGVGLNSVGLGTRLQGVSPSFAQGGIEATGRATDIAIQGNGFFIVRSGDGYVYTRKGSFTLSPGGALTTQEGLPLQGFAVDGNGAPIGPLTDITFNGATSQPSPTTSVKLQNNLDATAPVLGPFDGTDWQSAYATSNTTTTVKIFDSLGVSHDLTLFFTKTGANTWELNVAVDAGETGGTPGEISSPPLLTQAITFNADGSLADPAPSDFTVTFAGADAQTINFDFGTPNTGPTPGQGLDGLTQFGSPSSVAADANGYGAGQLQAIAVAADGTITGVFDNGESRALYRLGLADFAAPDGLIEMGSGLYRESPGSGAPSVSVPGAGGIGSVVGAAIERSNVDLASEFVDLISLQRSFQANARVITTSDGLLNDLINIVR